MEMATLDRAIRRKNSDIRKLLDKNFKPQFKSKPKAGIPIRELILYIENSDITSMPATKLSQLMHMYDLNNDGLISYKEFTSLMLAEHDRFELSNMSRFKRFVLEFTATTVPHHKQVDYLQQYTCKPPPLFMIVISLVEVACFVYYAVKLTSKGCIVDATNGVSVWSPMIYDPVRRYEVWRFLTYVVIHVGYLHLIVNLIFQLFLGIPLEMVHGWWRILLIYGSGAFTGSLAHSVADNRSYLAGASGGAYAIASAHVANVIMNWEEMQVDWLKNKPIRFLLSAPVRLAFIVIIAGGDTAVAFYNKFMSEEATSTSVGIAAHIGGMLTGLLLGIPVLKNIDQKPWETVVFWISLIIYIIIVAFAVLWNILWPADGVGMHFPETNWVPIANASIIPPGCV